MPTKHVANNYDKQQSDVDGMKQALTLVFSICLNKNKEPVAENGFSLNDAEGQ